MFDAYFNIYVIDIIALGILCVLICSHNMLNVDRKKPFLCGIILTVLVILSEYGTIIASKQNAALRFLNIFCNVLGFALAPAIIVILISIFDTNIFKKNKLLLLPTLINALMAICSPLFGFIFYVDANNNYERGDFFFVFVTAYILNLMLLFISTVRSAQKHNYPIKGKLIGLSLFTIAGTSIQLMIPEIYSSWHCVTLSLFMYFMLLSEFDASFDKLTGLLNRAAFEKVSKTITAQKAFAVIVIDINNFKTINDTYGHDFGDRVLKTTAETIKKCFEKNSMCFRAGGDEFYIISKETDSQNLERQIKSMICDLALKRKTNSRLPEVAYGYSIFKGDKNTDFHEILKQADGRMYSFKKDQKKCDI